MSDAFATAARLVVALDPQLLDIVLLSLRVSLSAVLVAALLGLPLGAALAVSRFPGRRTLIVLLNAQTVLILPIMAALSRQVIEDAWHEYEEQLQSLGAGRVGAALTLLWDT